MTGIPVVRAVPPDEMTWRARCYLAIGGARHLATGGVCLTAFQGEHHDLYVLRSVFPMWLWGLLFVVGGLHLLYSGATGHEGNARVGLGVSAVLTSVWAAGFTLTSVDGGALALLAAILFTALTLKDLVVCRQPMRSPFEPILREYAHRDVE